eukprot:tig00000692_g3199.t1
MSLVVSEMQWLAEAYHEGSGWTLLELRLPNDADLVERVAVKRFGPRLTSVRLYGTGAAAPEKRAAAAGEASDSEEEGGPEPAEYVAGAAGEVLGRLDAGRFPRLASVALEGLEGIERGELEGILAALAARPQPLVRLSLAGTATAALPASLAHLTVRPPRRPCPAPGPPGVRAGRGGPGAGGAGPDGRAGVYAARLGGLGRLRRLRLARNNLRELPAWLPRLAALESLVLDECSSLAALAAPGPLAGLGGSLRELSLRRVEAPERPHALGELLAALPKLEDLRLDCLRLERLPDEAARLPALRILTLHKNGLLALPAGLLALPRLEELDLSRNALRALPGGLAEAPALRTLHLFDNMIAGPLAADAFPASMRHVTLWGNPLEAPALAALAAALAPRRCTVVAVKPGKYVHLAEMVEEESEVDWMGSDDEHAGSAPADDDSD